MINFIELLESNNYFKNYSCKDKYDWETFIFENLNDKPSKMIINQWINDIPLKKCKSQAKQLLINSDWSELPSVIEQLENANEWKSYRMEIRKFIINPIENPVFPSEPETRWKEI